MAPTLVRLGTDIGWGDVDAAAAAREQPPVGAGRLAELIEWLAATQGAYPPPPATRTPLLTISPAGESVAALADAAGVGVRTVEAPTDVDGAVDVGAAAADDEIEAGTDLLVLADPDAGHAPGVVVSVVTGAEPVTLLPRGADAIDSAAWIEAASRLRDARRRAAALRAAPDQLLLAAGSAALAVSTGVIMRAAARRTPVLLDGTSALAAAVLCREVQPRVARWVRIADVSPHPVHARATAEFAQRPLLDLGTSRGDGTAALLCLPVLRAAAALAGSAPA